MSKAFLWLKRLSGRRTRRSFATKWEIVPHSFRADYFEKRQSSRVHWGIYLFVLTLSSGCVPLHFQGEVEVCSDPSKIDCKAPEKGDPASP